jgi:very-short-patch-repair endonuclease
VRGFTLSGKSRFLSLIGPSRPGQAHDGREAYANRRAETLELFGYLVLRFRNARVLADPDGAADDILTALRSASL